MGIPDTVVVLLCILGAAAFVVIGFSMNKLFTKVVPGEGDWNVKNTEQLAYMREVRDRNVRETFGDYRPHPYQHRQQQQYYHQQDVRTDVS